MSMLDTSKTNASFKKLLGRAHTDNDKEAANEALFSFVQSAAGTTFGEDIPAVPNKASLYDTTSGRVEWVRLVAVPDASANGHAFTLHLPSAYESSSSNSKAGTGEWVNSTKLANTSGKIQIVPAVFGLDYEPKPYTGGTSAQGSGSLVAPGDVRDWLIDLANGVLFQENDPDTNPTDVSFVECFIYIGDMVTDALGGGIADLPISEVDATVNASTETVDFVDTTEVGSVKWLINAEDASNNLYACEVFASTNGTLAAHQEYGVHELPAAGALDFDIDVDINGSDMRLRCTSTQSNVELDVTRIVVKLA